MLSHLLSSILLKFCLSFGNNIRVFDSILSWQNQIIQGNWSRRRRPHQLLIFKISLLWHNSSTNPIWGRTVSLHRKYKSFRATYKTPRNTKFSRFFFQISRWRSRNHPFLHQTIFVDNLTAYFEKFRRCEVKITWCYNKFGWNF